jgi:hypothetical protein
VTVRCEGGLQPFHDNNRTIILRHFLPEYNESWVSKISYTEMLSRSIFAAAPRGDNKFSYRFTEVLSAGAIPVILADDWVWPFRPELIKWEECAVILPENRVNETMIVLESISAEQRCKMRQRCFEIYQLYFATPEGIIAGLVEGLERVAIGKRARMSGVQCNDVRPVNPSVYNYTDLHPDECYMKRRRRRL